MLCFTHCVWRMWGKDSEVWSRCLQHYLLMLKDVYDTIKLTFSEQWCVSKEVNPSVASVAHFFLVCVGGRGVGGSKVLLTCLELQKDFSQEKDLLEVKGTVKPKKVGCWRLCHERQYFTAEVKCVVFALDTCSCCIHCFLPFPIGCLARRLGKGPEGWWRWQDITRSEWFLWPWWGRKSHCQLWQFQRYSVLSHRVMLWNLIGFLTFFVLGALFSLIFLCNKFDFLLTVDLSWCRFSSFS